MSTNQQGKVYLIPTVISEGQNHVIPEQVITVIKKLDYFLVENLRTARRYISSLNLGLVIENLSFELVDKNTRQDEIEHLMEKVISGRNVGVMSESGCPGVADPGARVVQFAHKHQIKVMPLVGPSSILLALMASGFNGQRFAFHGYLPVDKRERSQAIISLEKESSKLDQTQIFIETPYRNKQLLEAILATCRNNTLLCVARDVTGEFESVVTETVENWKNRTMDVHKVPVVFLLYCGANQD